MRRARVGQVALALVVVAAQVGCGGASPAASAGAGAGEPEPPPVPERNRTAGDDLLALLPAGAELVVELDLARLRTNPTVGPVFAAAGASPAAERPELGPLFDADLMALAVYDLAGRMELLSVVRGERAAARIVGATRIDHETAAVGSGGLVGRLEAVTRGEAPALARDAALMRVRAQAMPERAPGAALRASGRFDFEARVALARRFDLDAVPAAISIWGDVVDDLAVVALLEGEGAAEAEELVRAVGRLGHRAARARAAAPPQVAPLFAALIGATEVSAQGDVARVVVLVGPRRLERLAGRLVRGLEASARPPADDASGRPPAEDASGRPPAEDDR